MSITSDNNILRIDTTDDGKGFDTEARRTGIGISNMINRVVTFDGKLNIASAPGEGCTISIQIPL